MLDMQFIRENAEAVKKNCADRRMNVDIDGLLSMDSERRALLRKVEDVRAARNRSSRGKPSAEEIQRMRAVGEELKRMEDELKTLEESYTRLLWSVPNLVHESVPAGKDETQNVVVRTVGTPAIFDFKAKEHWELGETLGLIDMRRAADVSGARFAYLKGDLALLEFALVQHTLSIVTDEGVLQKIARSNKLDVAAKPFVPVIPPVLMRPDVMHRMGRLEPRDERYHIESDDLYLVGSAEHTLGPLHMDELVPEQDLPIRYIGFSTAFRREAGSYGKDMKGILRVHQFDKLEFESFTAPENGLREQNFILAIQEYLMQSLDLPYHVVQKCTGDMGAPDFREFDIEAWLPGQGRYRETHTSDYMTDYQSRRLNTRLKRRDGTTAYVHMNDATVFAIGRTIIAIMENYQREDGSIEIPKVLRPYMGGKKKIV